MCAFQIFKISNVIMSFSTFMLLTSWRNPAFPSVGFSNSPTLTFQLCDTLSPGFPWFLVYTSAIRLLPVLLLATDTFVFSVLVSPAWCRECRHSTALPHPGFFVVTLISGMLLVPLGLPLDSVL